MNDRYLYKAKRKHDSKFFKKGEWVEGAYYIEPYTDKCFIIQWNSTGLGFNEFIEVDGSSVCQCTGLKDKNGKLIWENDICRRILLPTKRIETNFRIAYVPYKCCLSAIDLDGSNVTFLSDYINNQYEVEVIGSAIDNQELLEVGE